MKWQQWDQIVLSGVAYIISEIDDKGAVLTKLANGSGRAEYFPTLEVTLEELRSARRPYSFGDTEHQAGGYYVPGIGFAPYNMRG